LAATVDDNAALDGCVVVAKYLPVTLRPGARQKNNEIIPRQRSLFFNKSEADYVSRRFNASSARLIEFGSWTFAETPLCAISRSNWSSELPE
jgi:hypothetical protein